MYEPDPPVAGPKGGVVPPIAAVPPVQNCRGVVFIDPGDKSEYTFRFLEQLVVPFRSDIVSIY